VAVLASGGLDSSVGAAAHRGLDLDPTLALVLAVLLVALNGFFVAAEFALVKVRATQIEPHVKRGDRRAVIALKLTQNLDSYLSAVQLGITLASLALGWIGEPAFSFIVRPLLQHIPGITESLVQTVSATIAFLVITVLHIVLGEMAPKSFAIRVPEQTSLWIAIPLYLFNWVAYPAIWVLNKASIGFLRLIGLQVEGHDLVHSEEELRLLLASKHGVRLSVHKRHLLDNVLELSHRTARQAMVPRADVAFVTLEDAVEDAVQLSRERGYTRLPLCEGDLDHVTGFVHIKDLLIGDARPATLKSVRRNVLFVPETLSLDRLLRRMRRKQMHMAIVVDEYGGTSGIVTLEDVIEQIVGPIQDEFDAEGPKFERIGTGEYRVAGSVLIADLEDRLGVDFSDRDEDTVGGIVMSEIGRIPSVGDKVELGKLEIEVTEVDRSRVLRVIVRVRSEVPVEADDDSE
jgi:CBS domain containing-hemolysin-like protein